MAVAVRKGPQALCAAAAPAVVFPAQLCSRIRWSSHSSRDEFQANSRSVAIVSASAARAVFSSQTIKRPRTLMNHCTFLCGGPSAPVSRKYQQFEPQQHKGLNLPCCCWWCRDHRGVGGSSGKGCVRNSSKSTELLHRSTATSSHTLELFPVSPLRRMSNFCNNGNKAETEAALSTRASLDFSTLTASKASSLHSTFRMCCDRQPFLLNTTNSSFLLFHGVVVSRFLFRGAKTVAVSHRPRLHTLLRLQQHTANSSNSSSKNSSSSISAIPAASAAADAGAFLPTPAAAVWVCCKAAARDRAPVLQVCMQVAAASSLCLSKEASAGLHAEAAAAAHKDVEKKRSFCTHRPSTAAATIILQQPKREPEQQQTQQLKSESAEAAATAPPEGAKGQIQQQQQQQKSDQSLLELEQQQQQSEKLQESEARARGGAGSAGKQRKVPTLLALGAVAAAVLFEAGRIADRAAKEDRSIQDVLRDEARLLDAQMTRLNEQLHLFLDQRIKKKAEEPLLPDLQEINAPDLTPTLVLNFDNVLASISYDPVKGYKIRKRPAVEQFLSTLANFYEIIVWSNHPFPYIEDLLRTKLEWPVTFTLHQDNMSRRGSSRYRDLLRLGRRIDRIIYIDVDSSSLPADQRDNFIKVPAFHGEAEEMLNDRSLPNLVDLLISAAISPTDVRLTLRRYGGGGDGFVGERFLHEKETAVKKADQRRHIGRVFGFGAPAFSSLQPAASTAMQQHRWEKA